MTRISKTINLSDEARAELEMRSRSQTIERRMADRAQIILLSSDGKTFDEICSQLNTSPPVVNKWRMRYRKEGLAGLRDQPRSGKPLTISATIRAQVIELARSKPTDGYSNWSQRRIAQQVGISQNSVTRILQEADLKPHKIEYWCGHSTDPEFETKMAAIVGLYLDPPDNALVLCVDEKTQIQALDRSQPELPLRSGEPRRQTTTYKRHGTVSLIAALAVHQGDITAQQIDRNTAANFLKFLKKLDRKYRNKTLHIIADNFSAHKHSDVKQWLKKKKRKIKIYYTPTYSSWLNQIEIWFNILTKDVLKGGVWRSKKHLVDQLMQYVDTYNKSRAKPFQWNYTGKPLKI